MHYGEFITDPCTEHLQGYVVKEITSSGLSHSGGDWPYIGPLFYHKITLNVPPRYSAETDRYIHRNYGILDFQLGDTIEQSKLHATVRDLEGKTVLQEFFTRDHFKKAKINPDMDAYNRCKFDFMDKYTLMDALRDKIYDPNNKLIRLVTFLLILAIISLIGIIICLFKCLYGVLRLLTAPKDTIYLFIDKKNK